MATGAGPRYNTSCGRDAPLRRAGWPSLQGLSCRRRPACDPQGCGSSCVLRASGACGDVRCEVGVGGGCVGGGLPGCGGLLLQRRARRVIRASPVGGRHQWAGRRVDSWVRAAASLLRGGSGVSRARPRLDRRLLAMVGAKLDLDRRDLGGASTPSRGLGGTRVGASRARLGVQARALALRGRPHFT